MDDMPHFPIDFLTDYSESAIIAELQRLAQQLGKTSLSRKDIDTAGRVSSSVVLKRFGSLRHALQAAQLSPSRFMKATDTELLDLLEALWVKTLASSGRTPERSDLKARGFPVSGDTIARRFGSWKKALLTVAERATTDPAEASDPPLAKQLGTTPHTQRATLSVRKRFLVFKRDGYTCRLCRTSGGRLEVDHIVPVAKGGSDSLLNLQTLCYPCNRGKRDSVE